MSALHYAVSLGQTAAVEMLCKDSRSAIELSDIDGKTALHLAVELGNLQAVEIVLRLHPSNCNIQAADFKGNTVLHVAAAFPNPLMMRLLLNHIIHNEQCSPRFLSKKNHQLQIYQARYRY